MPLKRSKKTSKKALEEGSLSRRFKLDDKKEAKEAKAKIKAEEEAKKETERTDKIIYKYLTKLDQKFKETDTTHFWVWADRSDFKKIIKNKTEMQVTISKNPEKYIGKHIANFSIQLEHKSKGKERLFGDPDRWMSILLELYTIDKNGKISGSNDPFWACHWVWLTDDFKITKFSFKLLERIMRIVNTKKVQWPSLGGFSLHHVIKDIREKKFKIDDVLQPLAGV